MLPSRILCKTLELWLVGERLGMGMGALASIRSGKCRIGGPSSRLRYFNMRQTGRFLKIVDGGRWDVRPFSSDRHEAPSKRPALHGSGWRCLGASEI